MRVHDIFIEAHTMGKIVIDLQEGFSNDAVEITVNGKLTYSEKSISTDLSTGLADSILSETEDDTIWLEVSLPQKKIQNKILLNVNAIPYIGVKLTNSSIFFTSSTDSFIYT